MTPIKLTPDADHAAAARSFRQAARCIRFAKQYPWTAERELVSAEQWKQSGLHWRRMAKLAGPLPAEGPQKARRWAERPKLSWEAELAILLSAANAAKAGVE